MQTNKLSNNATDTIKPVIYQFYIALEKCFDLLEGESIYIETCGDVTLISNNGSSQIEVKDYENKLTNLDHNIWKTLKNWLNDPNVTNYKNLILLTTQELGSKTSFKDWNNLDRNKKLEILQAIYDSFHKQQKQSSETMKLLKYVLDRSRESNLLDLLDKFIILSSQNNDQELYQRLIQSSTSGVMSDKKSDYINSLMGFIISPPITSTGWEITYKSFQTKTESLIGQFSSKTVIFPATYRSIMATKDQEIEHSEHNFIKKIDEIEYREVKSDAISDFIYTNKMILEEAQLNVLSKEDYNNYQKEIHDNYLSKHRINSRNTENSRIIKDSKNFYDDIISENALPFRCFNDTPKRFRNGLLHQMADDDSDDNIRKITWKLKVDKDE